MRFTFVDRILDLQPGVKITTVKTLTLGEEYLADHFPRFPVMPGVLMLQALTEAGAWLVRASENFAHSIVTLKEAKNVRFADFVQPGRVLTVTAEIIKSSPEEVQLKAQGQLTDRPAVGGRLILERYNLADKRPELAASDNYLRRLMEQHFSIIYQPLTPTAPDDVTLVAGADAARAGQGKA